MIKTIFFDFWGTLLQQGVRSPIKAVRAALHLKMPFTEFVIRFEHTLMTREFPSLKEGFKSVLDEFKISEESLSDYLVGLWNKNWLLARPFPETFLVLERLKRNYSLGLISNCDNFSTKNALEKFDLKKYFDFLFFSCENGLIKSDPGFFKKLSEKYNLVPEECLIVGDSIASDMKAREANFKVVLLDRSNSRNFSPQINNLKELFSFLGEA